MAIALGHAAPMTNDGMVQKEFCLISSGLSICIISLAKPVSFLLERINRWLSVSFILKQRRKIMKNNIRTVKTHAFLKQIVK